MKAKVLIAVVAVALTLASCESTTRQSRSVQARVAQANAEVVVINPTVKVQVDPARITDVWKYQDSDLEDYKAPLASDIKEKLKIDATNKTLKKHGGDILVAPLIDVETTYKDGVLKSYTVTVYGYIGTFVDWDKDGIDVSSGQGEAGEATERVRVSVSTIQ